MAKKIPDAGQQITDFGRRVFDTLKALFGGRWEQFNEDERDLVERVAHRAAAIGVAELAGVDMKRERAQVKAQLSNLKSAGEIAVVDLLWRSFWLVVSQSLSFAAALL